MLKRLIISCLFASILISLFFACSKAEIKIDKTHFVAFRHGDDFDSNGIPKDSLSEYFPRSIFTDTIEYYINKKTGVLFNPKYFSKERAIQISEIPLTLDDFKDTLVVEIDSVDLLIGFQYQLYKMGEPSLSNQYLGKDMYRLVVDRSFDKPFIIRIEKDNDGITAYWKILDRAIGYPFIKMGTSEDMVSFIPPPGVEADYDIEEHKKAMRKNDSLAAIYNNPHYFNEVDKSLKLTQAAWDSIELQIGVTGFWKSKPFLDLNTVQIDGSRWILEGHTKEGYQIKKILSPHFDGDKYDPHQYDKNNDYAKLFVYLMNQINLKEELY